MKKFILLGMVLILVLLLAACGSGSSIDGKWDDGFSVTEFKKGDIYIDSAGDESIGTYKKIKGDKYEFSIFGIKIEYEATVDGDTLILTETDTGSEDKFTRVK